MFLERSQMTEEFVEKQVADDFAFKNVQGKKCDLRILIVEIYSF